MGPFQSHHNSKHTVEKMQLWLEPYFSPDTGQPCSHYSSLAGFPLRENESPGHEELSGLSVWMHVCLHHYDN